MIQKEKNLVHEPIQARSIAKKNKIIKAGINLICKKGYHNVSTPDIAKAAGVSTGIIYNYFEDKHDILIKGVEISMKELFLPMFNIDTNMKIKSSDFSNFIKNFILELLECHKKSKISHEQIMSLIHSDKEVANLYIALEMQMDENFTLLLLNNGFSKTNLNEKVHISLGLIDTLCHEIVFHNHNSLDDNKMIMLVHKSILNLFDKQI